MGEFAGMDEQNNRPSQPTETFVNNPDDVVLRFLVFIKKSIKSEDTYSRYDNILNVLRAGLGRFYPLKDFSPPNAELLEKHSHISNTLRLLDRLLNRVIKETREFPDLASATAALSRRADVFLRVVLRASDTPFSELDSIITGGYKEKGVTSPLRPVLNDLELTIVDDLVVGLGEGDIDKAVERGNSLVAYTSSFLPSNRQRPPKETIGDDFLECLMATDLQMPPRAPRVPRGV